MYEAGEATQLPIKLHSTVRGTLDNEDLNEDGDCCSLRWDNKSNDRYVLICITESMNVESWIIERQ